MRKLAILLPILCLPACANLGKLSDTPLSVATHADLQAAAKYASDHGYPARAAVWLAHDAHLSAVEAQINACADAISAALPKPSSAQPLSPFLAVEMAAETVGSIAVPASVKINCAPFPIIGLPVLPRL